MKEQKMSKDDEAVYKMLLKTLEYLQLASEQLMIHQAYAKEKAAISYDLLTKIDEIVKDCKNVINEYKRRYVK